MPLPQRSVQTFRAVRLPPDKKPVVAEHHAHQYFCDAPQTFGAPPTPPQRCHSVGFARDTPNQSGAAAWHRGAWVSMQRKEAFR